MKCWSAIWAWPAAPDAPMFQLPTQGGVSGDGAFIDVCASHALTAGGQTTVLVGFMRVLVLRTVDGGLHAVADLCPHALQPLAGGEVQEGQIRCPKHGACFDLVSGQPRNRLTSKPLTLYRVRERDGRIEVAAPIRA